MNEVCTTKQQALDTHTTHGLGVRCHKTVIKCGKEVEMNMSCHTSKQIENFFQERGVKVKREKSPLSSARTNYFEKAGGVTI